MKYSYQIIFQRISDIIFTNENKKSNDCLGINKDDFLSDIISETENDDNHSKILI